MDSVKEGIRLNLIELLERTGKKRIDLAKACGVGKSAVSNWVSGESSIDVERIPSICEFFEISVDEFFGRSEQLEPSPKFSKDEIQLLFYYRNMNDANKDIVLNNCKTQCLSSILDDYGEKAMLDFVYRHQHVTKDDLYKSKEEQAEIDKNMEGSHIQNLDEFKEIFERINKDEGARFMDPRDSRR